MATDPAPLLAVQDLHAGHGAARVLHGVSLQVAAGETLVVIGRNGVGKTTLVETLMGLTQRHAGQIMFAGQDIGDWPPHRRNRAGIAWVPQQREVFASLTVAEHLQVLARPGSWDMARVFELFPRLHERRKHHGDQLSGGEQQMLAMGRALVTNPRLLLLDEPVEGLAPIVVLEMLAAIDKMQQGGDGRGGNAMAILLVEQKYELALARSQRCLVLDRGAVVHSGESAALLAQPALIAQWLGVDQGA